MNAFKIRATSALGTIALSVAMVGAGVSVPSGSALAASVATAAPFIGPGTQLTDTTLGPGTLVFGVDMVTPTLGYGVALATGPEMNWMYLVQTTDVGDSWTVRGALPLASSTGPYAVGAEPLIDFVNRQIGYAGSLQGPLFVTSDAGATWSKVATPGIWPTFAINATTLAVVSDVCAGPLPAYGPLRCPSQLSRYRVGSAAPMTSFTIPGVGVGPWRAAVALAAPSPTSTVVVEGAREGRPSSILESNDAGASWRRLANPCQGLMVLQLLMPSPSHWLLYCYMGGGMTQGTSQLWRSANQGTTWTIVASANEQANVVGNIRDVSNTLTFTNNQEILFGALGGAAGGLEYSVDGGGRWAVANVRLNSGGAPEYVSPFGPQGAVVGVQSGPIFRTRDGLKWTALPGLPAGVYHGLAICTSKSGTTARLGRGSAAAGTAYEAIVYTNHSTRSCYLNGVPIAQPVVGPNHTPVGRAAYQYLDAKRGGFVVLKPNGGFASTSFGLSTAANYPIKDCLPKTVNGLTLRFASPAVFYVTTPRWTVCAKTPVATISGVSKGVVLGP